MQRIPFAAEQDMPGGANAWQMKSPISRLMAHAATMMPAIQMMSDATFARLELKPIDRELAMIATAHLQGGRYEWVQHEVKAEAMGLSRAQIEAIARGDFASPAFDARQQAYLAFVRQMVMDVRADDATFDAVVKHFSYRELVETIFVTGGIMTAARITENAGVHSGPVSGMAPILEAQARLAAEQAAQGKA